MKYVVLVFVILHMLFLAYLNNTYLAGIPFRSLLVIIFGGLVLLQGSSYVTDLKLINVCYALLFFLGVFVSIVNQAEFGVIFTNIFRLLQSYLLILTGYYLLIQFGYKVMAFILLLVAVPSAIVGVLQLIGVEFAWHLREVLGRLQNTMVSQDLNSLILANKNRVPGLTLFAIEQAYLLFAALASVLFLYIRAYERRENTNRLLVVIAILFLGIIASETRSVLAATLILIVFTFFKVRFSLSLLVGIFLFSSVIAYHVYSDQQEEQETDARVLTLDDASAKGRVTLYKFGVELALINPLGYGYGFDSTEIAIEYFSNERNIFNYSSDEKAQFVVEIHNALLNIFHIYGLIGFIVFVVFIYQLASVRWFFSATFFSYLINSFFHNKGIMLGDLYFDSFIAIVLYYKYYINKKVKHGGVVNGNSFSNRMFFVNKKYS